MFSVILEEIQRTSCQPREVCVEVTKEYPESNSQFYLPRCVALHRCGGCCNNEAYYCANTSHALINKTVSGTAGFSFFLASVFISMSDTFLNNYSTQLHDCVGVFCSHTSNCLRNEDRNQSTPLCNKLICIAARPTAMGRPLAATGHQVTTIQSRTSCTTLQSLHQLPHISHITLSHDREYCNRRRRKNNENNKR